MSRAPWPRKRGMGLTFLRSSLGFDAPVAASFVGRGAYSTFASNGPRSFLTRAY